MATIPVEKKAGVPWWLWLLGLLLLALLIWFFFLRDNDEVAVVDDTEAVVPVVADTGLDLSDVWVTRVVGDKTFFVAADSAGSPETLVFLEEEPTPGTATEGRYDVTVGQHLAIVGSMMPASDLDFSTLGADASEVGAEYIRASSLTVLEGAVGPDGMMNDGMEDGAMMDGAMDGAAATGDAIRRVDDLYAANLSGLIGRTVEVDNARVLSLVGDSTFYLGDGNRKVLVALSGLGESQTGPGNGTDGRFDINVGDRVDVRGTVTRFDAANSVFRGLSAADRDMESTRGGFVNVTSAAGVTKR